ncbi:MAG: hypothetical protein Q7T71_03045 [Herbiconiux sp.]|nr:hypothetical protein [Herbiconiux sp.]
MVQSFTLIDAASLGDLKVYLGRAARVDNGAVRLIGGLGVLAAYTPTLTPKGLLDPTPTVLGLRTFALASPDAFDVVVNIRALLDRLAQLSVLSNSESGPIEVPLPPVETGVAWAGISPPRGGWQRVDTLPARVLERASRAGITEVAAAVPEGTGEQLVHRVRSEVWGRDLPQAPELDEARHLDFDLPDLDAPTPGSREAAAAAAASTPSVITGASSGAGTAVPAVSGVVSGAAPAATDAAPAAPPRIPAGAAFCAVSLGFLKPDDEVSVFATGQWLRLTTRRGHVLVRR